VDKKWNEGERIRKGVEVLENQDILIGKDFFDFAECIKNTGMRIFFTGKLSGSAVHSLYPYHLQGF